MTATIEFDWKCATAPAVTQKNAVIAYAIEPERHPELIICQQKLTIESSNRNRHARSLLFEMELMGERISALADRRGLDIAVMLQICQRAGIDGKESVLATLDENEQLQLSEFIRKSPAQVKRLKDLHEIESGKDATAQSIVLHPAKNYPKIAAETSPEKNDISTRHSNGGASQVIRQLKTMPIIELGIDCGADIDERKPEKADRFDHIYGNVIVNYSRIQAKLKKLMGVKKNQNISAKKLKQKLPPSTIIMLGQLNTLRNLFAHEELKDETELMKKHAECRVLCERIFLDLNWITDRK